MKAVEYVRKSAEEAQIYDGRQTSVEACVLIKRYA